MVEVTNKVTVAEFANIIKGITRSTSIGLCYRVDEGKSRTVKGKKALQKEVCLSGYLNHNYTNKVKNLTGDTSFEAYEMKGKTRISGTLLESDRNGEPMLYLSILNNNKKTTTYFHNGVEISKDEAIKQELFAPSYFTKKPTMGRGIVSAEDDFGVITPYLSRLVWANVEGESYEITS